MRRRAEVEWPDTPTPTMGSAEVGPLNANDHPAGVIWVPDPEQRHGWREVYIDKPGSKAERGVGFRKPGAR